VLATFKQELTGKVEETSQAFSALKTTLDKTESFSQPRRTKASGGGGDELLTDC
ncbi:TPA: GPO family capsid scaffolding protein, partial [Salmonella enterica]